MALAAAQQKSPLNPVSVVGVKQQQGAAFGLLTPTKSLGFFFLCVISVIIFVLRMLKNPWGIGEKKISLFFFLYFCFASHFVKKRFGVFRRFETHLFPGRRGRSSQPGGSQWEL